MYISSRVVHKSSNNTHIKFGTRNFCLFLFVSDSIVVHVVVAVPYIVSSSVVRVVSYSSVLRSSVAIVHVLHVSSVVVAISVSEVVVVLV